MTQLGSKYTIQLTIMADNNLEKSIHAWLWQAKEDLKTAKALLNSGRYTWCAFACQQALEKCLKSGYVQKFQKIPPYTHKLEWLCQLLELAPPPDIIKTIINVDKYYIATRYPSYKKSVNISQRHVAVDVYRKTTEVFRWLVTEMNLKK